MKIEELIKILSQFPENYIAIIDNGKLEISEDTGDRIVTEKIIDINP